MIFAINGGSSSLKFAVYDKGQPLKCRIRGHIDRIGLSRTIATVQDFSKDEQQKLEVAALNHRNAALWVIAYLRRLQIINMATVGHRVVNGGIHFTRNQLITPKMLTELQSLCPFDPDHLPLEIELINLFREHFPDATQVACFDTAFHQDMPRVAQIIPVPRRLERIGIRRFGFHGLSYAFLLEELARSSGAQSALGRIVMCHLGNGASLAAIREGKSIDTSMGFSPASGIPMSTRSGDLDPELFSFLTRVDKMTALEFQQMVNRQSGLLGISETSSDVRDLLALENSDFRAAEAIDLFCYQVKKWIGSFAAALGGIDTLVFSGGIGENSGAIRKRICEGLSFLGVNLDDSRNGANAPRISVDDAKVLVRVIHTDEELMIAKAASECALEIQRQGSYD